VPKATASQSPYKNRRWAFPFSLANGGLAILLQHLILERENNLELGLKICRSCSVYFFNLLAHGI
jgi:hypothetical protein